LLQKLIKNLIICELVFSLSINRHLNNNGNEMMANKTINKTNIEAQFDNIVASTPNVNAAASTSIGSKQINLLFRNEEGIFVQEFDDTFDDTFNTDNVSMSISKNQKEVSLKTSMYLLVNIIYLHLKMYSS